MNMNTNKTFKVLLYISFVGIFIFWMMFSNQIISHSAGLSLKKVSFSSYSESTTPIHVHIDQMIIGEDLLKQVSIAGWMFGESRVSNSERYSGLLFVHENQHDVYLVDAVLNERADVRSVYQDLLPQNSTLNIGMMASFSTIGMKEGVYSLYAYCKENDQEFGIQDTNIKFMKNGTSYEQYHFVSESIPEIAIYNAEMNAELDIVNADKDYLYLYGWAFIKDAICANQSVFIKMSNDDKQLTFTTQPMIRKDVADAYKSEQYFMSGYQAAIPLKDMMPGEYLVEVIVKNGENTASEIFGQIDIFADGTTSYIPTFSR